MKLTLILPAYNEIDNIQKGTLQKISKYFNNKEDIQLTVLLIDDGSTDNTLKELEIFSKQDKRFKVIKRKHQGKAYSLLYGMREAKGDIIGFSDFDLATPIDEFDKIIPFLKTHDIVIGSRKTSREGAPLIRKIMAKGFIIVRDLLLNLDGVKDTQCGFKFFRKKVIKDIVPRLQVFRKGREVKGPSVAAAFDIEFLYRARRQGYSIKEIPVVWTYAETKRVNFFRDSIEALVGIIRIKFSQLKELVIRSK